MKFNDRAAIRLMRDKNQRALSMPEFKMETEQIFGEGKFTTTVGNASYAVDGGNITFKLTFAVAVQDAVTGTVSVLSKEAAAFKSQAGMFNLSPTWLGKTFRYRGTEYTIEGLSPRSYRYPVICKETRTGKGIKMPAETVISMMTVASSIERTAGEKRSEADILKDLQGIESQLSPENLCMDGEASRSYVQRRSAELQAQRRRLVQELGREPTDAEMYPGIF